ncbi:MFS transporter, DHA2 family, methylenomycin A resistance protein [Pseudoxanthomonas sp. GM95]|uniref:MFS transporter n=1 Tax=Pseudoxanthomonas sp. GM95 TaxID=1881043 RepID=UPI0008CCAAB9|nr:MFS transporter [Pseudoxanthomonas sp. GM95]SEM55154.1 MFS transporter, DHA2 family, methylenomycin A resistance protein [Pseudoxanthomonas sp. GM95]
MVKRASSTAVLIASCLGFLVVQLDVSVVNVGLGALQQAFNTGLNGMQWVINSYALLFSALLILAGGLGDKWGAKPVFALGFGIFTLASVGCGIASSMSMLIAMRCVQGLGAALLIPTSLTLIRLNFADARKRQSAVALWGACGGIALAAGPVIGGFLIEHVGWRSVFLVNIPIGLLAIGLTVMYTPKAPGVEKKLDLGGQATIAIALALMTYGLTAIAGEGWTLIPKACLILAAIFVAIFFMVERRTSSPMLPARLARNHILVATMMTGSVINLTFYGVVFVLSIYFQTLLHYDPVRTGLAFIPLTAVMTISSLLSARLAQRASPLSVMTAGLLIQVVGFGLLSVADPSSSAWLLNGALIIVGIGSASTVPSMNNSMLAAVSQHDAGIAAGLMSSARQAGGIIGVAVFGILISSTNRMAFTAGMSASMLICVAAVGACALLNLLLFRHAAKTPAQANTVAQTAE